MAGVIRELLGGRFVTGLALDSDGAGRLVLAALLESWGCWHSWALLGFAIVGVLLPPGIVFVLALLVVGFGLQFVGFPPVLPGVVSPGCLLGFGERLPRVPRFPGS